ncbi:archaetidylserine decarboxylase [Candidatus Pseudothioglobus singularis]|nr:archaetidylserine decarboxylase [Candidatus Pseudothioglobus singularis]
MFRFARIKTPWLKNSFTNWFVATYKVNLSEAERENVKDYEHFNDFFTRSLKKTSRPISSLPVISPVDGVVSQAGKINKSEIVQAKGKKYSVSALLDNKSIDAAYFNSFTTIYLSPKDYHRIHMPCDGDLVSMKYIPGDLFSVNQGTVNGIDQVFARNERLVCFFNTEFGEMAFILVGAIFVGSMQTSWEGQITPPYSKSVKYYNYMDQKIRLEKGDELGRFNMGSTVIILMPNDFPSLSLDEGQALKMGQSIT